MAKIPTTRIFRGFSTQGSPSNHNWNLYDIDLIKQDLMNAFMTRTGERCMRPDYGCAIWTMLLEPFTESLSDLIINEAVRICSLDERVQIIDIEVVQYINGIRIELTLNYLPFNVIGTFTVDFENRQTALFNTSIDTTSF